MNKSEVTSSSLDKPSNKCLKVKQILLNSSFFGSFLGENRSTRTHSARKRNLCLRYVCCLIAALLPSKEALHPSNIFPLLRKRNLTFYLPTSIHIHTQENITNLHHHHESSNSLSYFPGFIRCCSKVIFVAFILILYLSYP